ncbi:MAG: MBL fold metallo-hydrolase [Hydrogenothermaceae bacterium]|nr:MBL fold metallo-hydrolase [Hydrogenothermaceae bacterium]
MCFYLPNNTLIDAGNIFALEKSELILIKNIVLTHSHFDHICDVPFLVDYTINEREEPIKIYGLPETLEALKKNIFNETIWPAFDKIKLSKSGKSTMEYLEIFPYKEFYLEGYKIFPISSNHTVPTISLVVKRGERGFAYTSDTFKNPIFWDFVKKDNQIKTVFVDISFPSSKEEIANVSLHNTVRTLLEDISNLERKNLRIYAVHLKPTYEKEIIQEIDGLRKEGVRIRPLVGKKRFSL